MSNSALIKKLAPSRAAIRVVEATRACIKTSSGEKTSTSKAQCQTIEAIRTFVADVLSRFQDAPVTRHEAGFRAAFDEFGRLVNPGGYKRDSSKSDLIVALRKPRTKTSKAKFQTVEAVREYLALNVYPDNDRWYYGWEDAHWFLWTYVDPMGIEAAREYLPQ
jgi:hypothetical protein